MTDDAVLETTIRAGTLDTYCDILRALVDEAVLHIGNDGVQTSVVEAANVAMYNTVRIAPDGFASVPTGSFAIGVNLERLQDAIGKANPDALVDLSFDVQRNMLEVSYGRVHVDLACIDPDSIRKEPDTNDLDLPCHCGLGADDLADAVDIVDLVTDHIAIASTGTELCFSGEGDTDDADYTIPEAELGQPDLSANVESLFSMEYMDDLVGVIPAGTDGVALSFGDEFPLELGYDFADGAGHAEAMCAPRISSDG